MSFSGNSYLALLATLFIVWGIVLGIDPVNRFDWALENVLVAVGLIIICCTYKRFRFSQLSYTLIFIFLLFHEVGAHYTYSLVPYEDWISYLTGQSLADVFGWQRNHYDRLVHFLYGLLLYLPFHEITRRSARTHGIWNHLIPLAIILSTSLLYELLEWLAVVVFGGDLGMAYLGTQGDPWDAHKDSLFALTGALMAFAMIAIKQKRKPSPTEYHG